MVLPQLFGLAGATAAGAINGGTKGALRSAFTALVFYGVGQWANALENAGNAAFAAEGVGRAFLHGMAGGVLSELQGGEFGHGFLSAGVAKGISARVDLGNDFANGALAALIGGTVSELTGDKFANGAVTAALAFAFNQMVSKSPDERNMARARKLTLKRLREANPKSIEENREFSGYTYELDGRIGATPALAHGGKDCSEIAACKVNPFAALASVPKGARIIFDWHTHGNAAGGSRYLGNVNFSEADVLSTNQASRDLTMLGIDASHFSGS